MSDQKIKVLHLSSERSWRGGEQQIAYLIEELTKLGVDNYVAVKDQSKFQDYGMQKKLPVFPLPFRNTLDVGTALSIKKICRQHGIQLIHMHASKSHGIGVLSAALGCKVPLILSRRVDFVPKNNLITRWKYNHPSIKRILCVSNKINEIVRAYITQPEKSLTVHSGIDLSKFSQADTSHLLRDQYKISSDTMLIGNTSALEEHKDYFTFINTISFLVKRGRKVAAFIIGKGSLESELKNYVTEKGLDAVIHFTGFRDDITKILPELDIFLMTSNEEGLGTSVLDAFLARVAVVATQAGGIPEMVIHEKTGLLAPIADAETLAANIERLLSNAPLKRSLVDGAYQKVKEFSKEQTASKTLAVYRDVLSSR